MLRTGPEPPKSLNAQYFPGYVGCGLAYVAGLTLATAGLYIIGLLSSIKLHDKLITTVSTCSQSAGFGCGWNHWLSNATAVMDPHKHIRLYVLGLDRELVWHCSSCRASSVWLLAVSLQASSKA